MMTPVTEMAVCNAEEAKSRLARLAIMIPTNP